MEDNNNQIDEKFEGRMDFEELSDDESSYFYRETDYRIEVQGSSGLISSL